MAVKTKFSKKDFLKILSSYDLGEYKSSKPITEGTVQTNFFLETTKRRFVFRYYEQGRPKESVMFEVNLIKFLKNKKYPCPGVLKNNSGRVVGMYQRKPYAIFEFIEGQHLRSLSKSQEEDLIKKVAQLQNLTRNYQSAYKRHRWNYSPKLVLKLVQERARKTATKNASKKLAWTKKTVKLLNLPNSYPKGICHTDFDLSNILYRKGKFVALIDFDDANYTYLTYDLVHLVEHRAWPHNSASLNLKRAREVIKNYSRHRKLSSNEKRHLFDVYKLSILIDSIWFFERGRAKDFYERRKIEHLNNIGRGRFYKELFN